MTALVRIDERGRVALGKVAAAGDYRATRRADGSVILEPVHVVTEAELAVLKNPVVLDALDAAFEGDASKSVEYDWR